MLLAVFLPILLLHGPLSSIAGAETRHVLVLSSSERPFAPQSGFADAFVRDLIRASLDPIQLVEIPVQAARASVEAPDPSIAQRIRSAFGTGGLDLVVTIGGPAATFAQQFRQELFGATPLLIAGVDRRFVEHGTFTDNDTTVATQHDPALIIDEILRLLPETRDVMVVVGASHLERFWLEQMKRDFGRFGDRLQFSWTNELSFDEIRQRSRMMPARSAILFAILAVDGKGEPQVKGNTLASLHAVANAPLFALYGMGTGIVGGPLLSTDELSRTTAQVAVRVLAGESPGSIRTPVQRTGQPTYDARELRRWNIDERRLPAGGVVLFREPSIWTRIRGPILLGALLGAIPVVFLFVFAGRNRRRARSREQAANGALTPAIADATVSVWTAGVDGQRLQNGQAPGGSDDTWLASVHPDDVERCLETYRWALERREPFQMEYRVRDAGSVDRWILDTGFPRFSGNAFTGYAGSAVDITSLARSRADLESLSRHLMQAHEQERAAIARTLHEDVCQRMVTITLRLHHLKGAATDSEVADIKEQLTGLVRDLAAVSDPIQQRLKLLGVTAAGRQFCDDLSARYEVAIHFEEYGVPQDVPPEVAMALYRVLQEATVNAVVHSTADEVCVSLRGSAEEICLEIVDRGIGFDTLRAVPNGGVGLIWIRERLRHVGGDCEITSRPGEGTRIKARVALRREA